MANGQLIVSRRDIEYYAKELEQNDFDEANALTLLKTKTYGLSGVAYIVEMADIVQFMAHSKLLDLGINRHDIDRFKEVYLSKLVGWCVLVNVNEATKEDVDAMSFAYERFKNFCHRMSGYGYSGKGISRSEIVLSDIDKFLHEYLTFKSHDEFVSRVLTSKLTYL